MECKVEVKIKSARDLVKEDAKGKLIVHVKSDAKRNMANNAVIALLSRHFQTRPDVIKIIKGLKSKNKTVEVKNEDISP